MSKQFKELISPIDLLSLPKFKAYIKLMIDGVSSDPFSMQTFPLPSPSNGPELKEKVRRQSRQRYATKRQDLEKLIKIWAEKTFSPVEKAIEKAKKMKISDDEKMKIAEDKQQKIPDDKDLMISEDKKQEVSKDENQDVITIDNIQIGKWYKGIVKLKYNY
jgi:hypothetical protein